MEQILDQSVDAFQLHVRDPAIRAYLQRYPFATGPDKAMNELCRQAILEKLVLRNGAESTAVTRLLPHETQSTAEQMERLVRIMDESGVPLAERAELIDDYGWEVNLAPLSSKSVLVLGCADGMELMFLRAVLPEATITALDYNDTIPEARKRATGVRFFQGDMHALLAGFGQEFDLISSNHTLEHLYTPHEELARLAELLLPHGALISTLPMDAMAGSPFLEKVKETIQWKRLHPMDVVYLDAGHPWKTNPSDMGATMQEVGFDHPQFYQRQMHLSRYIALGEKQLKTWLAVGKVLNTFFFSWPRSLTKLFFAKNPPHFINRGFLAVERRVWFGTNRLKSRYTQEALVLARKGPAAA